MCVFLSCHSFIRAASGLHVFNVVVMVMAVLLLVACLLQSQFIFKSYRCLCGSLFPSSVSTIRSLSCMYLSHMCVCSMCARMFFGVKISELSAKAIDLTNVYLKIQSSGM